MVSSSRYATPNFFIASACVSGEEAIIQVICRRHRVEFLRPIRANRNDLKFSDAPVDATAGASCNQPEPAMRWIFKSSTFCSGETK
jgi:hypothetical protein